MKRLLFNLFKIVVIVSNILPLNALIAHAATQSASETRPPIEYKAEKIPYARPAPSNWMPGNSGAPLPKAPDAAASALPESRTMELPLPGNLALSKPAVVLAGRQASKYLPLRLRCQPGSTRRQPPRTTLRQRSAVIRRRLACPIGSTRRQPRRPTLTRRSAVIRRRSFCRQCARCSTPFPNFRCL